MPTETPVPTETYTPTETPTPSPTPTPTLNFYVEATLSPSSETEGARLERTVSGGEFVIALLLFAILVSLWGMYILRRLEGES